MSARAGFATLFAAIVGCDVDAVVIAPAPPLDPPDPRSVRRTKRVRKSRRS